MAKQLNVDLNLRANTQQAKSSLSDLQKTLSQIMNTNTITINDVSIEKAKQAAQELSQHLKNATNVNTGKLDLGKLSSNLQKSGQDLKGFQTQLSRIGPTGNQAFLQLAQSIAAADASAITLSSRMSGFLTTLKNTARWQISSSILHGFMGAIQGAYGYAQDLNKSLNNIRIVTGQSTDQMAAFAREANNAAKALSTSTLNYTDAALIYYQQGIRDQKEIEQRTTTTIKLANVSRQSAEDVSSEMTAIWNNFAKGSKNLEYYADVITALGAVTASSSQEIASGLQKFASVADTVGLSYEKASAALATIVAVTRQSEDVVGTALKTIFARVDSLKLGETLEDGVSLNKYAKALETVGVNILDSNQNLKDMDTILDDLGSKWSNISEAQRVALAETVAGQRQYAQFMALMSNYDQVLANQQVAQMSEGTLQKQQEIYAESWEAARDRVKASLQTIYDQLLDDKAFINLTNGLSKTINFISSLIDNLGGLKSILLIIGTIVMNTYATRMPAILSKLKDNFMVITGQAEKVRQKMLASATEALNDPSLITNNRSAAQVAGIQAITEAKLKLAQETKNLTEQEILERKAQIELLETRVQNTTALGAELDKTEEEIAALERKARLQLGGRNTTVSTDLNMGDFENVKSQITSEYGRTLSSFKGVAQGSEEYKNLQTQLQNLKREASEVQAIIAKISSGKMTNKQFVQEFSSAAKEVGKMHSALDVVEAKTKIWTKQLEQVKTGKISVADLKTEMTSFRDVLKDAGINTERIDKALDNLAADGAGLDALIDEFMQVGDLDIGSNLGIAEQKLEAFQTALHSLGVEDKVIEDLVTDIQNGENIAQKLQIALSNIKMPDQNIKKPIQFSEALGAVASAAMQTAMAINALKNIGNIWSDEDLSAGEKLLQTFMSLGQIIPLVTLFTDQSRLANLSDAAAKILGIGATTASTAAEAASIPVKGASAAATWAMVWPILALVAALGAVVGAVAIFVTVIKKMQAAREADRKSAENATKAAEELQQAYENTKQAYEDLQSTISNYDSAKEALDTLTEGTREWRDKLREANNEARQLIETYPELAKYSHYTSQGLLEISQEGLDEALEQQSQKVSESMSSAILAKANAEILSARADVTDLKNSQHWRTQTSDVLSGLGVIGGLLGGFAWPAGLAVGGFNIAANEHDSKIDKAIDEAVQAYADNAELVGKTDTQLAEMFDVTSDLIPKIRELGEATRQATENMAVSTKEALVALYEGNANIDNASAIADIVSNNGQSNSKQLQSLINQYTKNAADRTWNNAGTDVAKETWNKYAKYLEDELGYKDIKVTNYKGNGNISYQYTDEKGEVQKAETTSEAVGTTVATQEYNRNYIDIGEKVDKIVENLNDESLEALSIIGRRTKDKNGNKWFQSNEDAWRFIELMESGKVNWKSIDAKEWETIAQGNDMIDKGTRDGQVIYSNLLTSMFGENFDKEALQPYLEFKKSLNLTEESKKAVDALKNVKDALKEVMTPEDWAKIDAELTKAGITDFSSEDLKGLTYEQQKNILDTAYRRQLEKDYDLQQSIIDTKDETLAVVQSGINKNIQDTNTKYQTEINDQNTKATYAKEHRHLSNGDGHSRGDYYTYDDYIWLYNEAVKTNKIEPLEFTTDSKNQTYIVTKNQADTTKYHAAVSEEKANELQDNFSGLLDNVSIKYKGSSGNSEGVLINYLLDGFDDQAVLSAIINKGKETADLYAEQTATEVDQEINSIQKRWNDAIEKLKVPEKEVESSVENAEARQKEIISDFNTNFIRTASTLRELDNEIAYGNDKFKEGWLNAGDYSQALISMASNYDNAADEVAKFNAALFQSDETVIEAAENSLRLSIRVGELAQQYGLVAEDVEMQARLIQSSMSAQGNDISGEQAAELATRNQRLNRGIKSLVDNFETWNETLRTANHLSMDYAEALNDAYEAVADLTGAIDTSHIPIDFLNADTEKGKKNLDNLAKAAKGDTTAINELNKALVLTTFENLDYTKDVKEYKDEDGNLISKLIGDPVLFEQTKNNIVDSIQTIFDYIDENGEGHSLAEALGGSENARLFIDRLNEMAKATGMTVQEMNSYLAQIGLTIPEQDITVEKITTHSEVPKMVSTTTGGIEGNLLTGYKIHATTETVQDDTTPVEQTLEVPVIGDHANIKTTTINTGGGVSTSSSTANASSSSSTNREAGKNVSDETARYHVINKETEQLTKAYDRLNTAKDRAFGANRLKLMDAEIANTKKQIALNKEYIKEAQAYAQQDYNNLINGKQNAYTIDGQWYSSEGLRGLGVELQLDENGVIQNYDEIMAAATAKYNERIAAYNANPENSNLKEIAEGEFNAIKELISQYEETNELVQDKLDENQKLINQLQDQNLEKFNYKLELKLKISEREKKRIEFELREIGDDAFKSAEVLSKMFSTDGSANQWTNAIDQLQTYKDSFKELNELYEKGDISEEGYIEGLEEISNGIYDQLESILDLKDTMEDYYKNTLSKLKEKYDALYASMTHGNEVLEHMKTLLGLIGKSTDYDSIGKLLEGQAEISKNAYNVSKADYEKDKRLREQREKELEEAEKKGGEEQIKIAKEQLAATREAEQASQLQMLTDLENYLTKRQEIINNNIEKSYAESEKILSNGMGFDYLNQSMELAAAGAERFYTKTNQLYETDKMRRKLQQDIDKTTNAAAKQRLAAFDQEIQQMQDKNQLSKVELSLAQARYELLLAEIALEEAQNAKTTVRLQRDAEGNYGYVYTADQSKIADAEQEVADKRNNLYNTAREAEQNNLQESVKLRQDMNEALKAIDQDEYLSWEEKEQKKDAITAYYLQQIEDANNDHSKAIQLLNETSATSMNDTWTNNFKEVMTNQTGMVNSFISEQDRLDEYLYGKDGQGGAFKDLANAARDVLGVELNNLGAIISDNTTKSKEFKEELIGKDGKGGLVKATEDEANEVADLTLKFGKAYDAAEDFLQSCKDINEQIDELIKKAAEDITIKTNYEDTHNVKYNFTYTHTGNPPPEYKDTEVTVSGGENRGKLPQPELDDKPYKIYEGAINSKKDLIMEFADESEAKDYFMKKYIDNNRNEYKGKKYLLSYGGPVRQAQLEKGETVILKIPGLDANQYLQLTNPEAYKKGLRLYDTGGYTGQWYHSSDDPMMSGKLAMLHEKELVLNQEDTKNFLASIEMVRDLARIIDLQAASVGLRQQLEARFGFDAAQGELAQNIVIHADFPNATDHNEIMEAFETLADRAAQYANRTNRLIDSMQQRR